MISYMARPQSTLNIRELALGIRKQLNIEDVKKFPILVFLEHVLPVLYEGFHVLVLSKEEMGNIHGLACPNENCIKIREDVYENAYAGKGRDRFTVAHEVGHFIMHTSENITLARLGNEEKVQAFRNPEWQADTFAAELLMPLDLIDTTNPFEIANEFGVSYTAASIRVKKINMH